MKRPTLGSIVHYWTDNGSEIAWAAIVALVHEDGSTVDLHAFPPEREGSIARGRVPYAPRRVPGSWSWPRTKS